MADFGIDLLSRCNTPVDGILSRTHTDELTAELKKTPDECGENVQAFTRNLTSVHEYEGEITGNAVSGICDWTPGQGETPPFTFADAGGGDFICTRGRFTENAGEYAKFGGSLDNSENI